MKTIDFSAMHNVLLRNEDGTLLPADVPYYAPTLIAPDTWAIVSDGDYTYLLAGTEDTLVIDSGCGAGNIREFCQTLTDKPVWRIASTHHHFDHTANNCNFDQVYMAESGIPLASIPFPSFEAAEVPRDYPVEAIGEGHVFHLGERDVEVIMAMPDHAVSSLLYLDRKTRILFVGDEIGNHGMMLQGTVENRWRQLKRLETYRGEFDYMCGGSHYMIPADYVEKYIANCEHILAGNTPEPLGKGGGPGGPKGGPGGPGMHKDSELTIGPNGEKIYDRKKPRPEDRGNGGNPEDAKYRVAMEYAGARIIYDSRKVFDEK